MVELRDHMEFSVYEALRRAGEPFPYVWDGTLEPQEYAGHAVVFSGDAHVEGTFVFDGKAFTVTGEAVVPYQAVCARCCEPFCETLRFSFSERFVRAVLRTDEDDEAYPYEGERIVLDKAFYDNLFLALPPVSVCKPDCKGLCPVCGANLNQTTCNCRNESCDGPFGALQQLLNENKEV